MYDFVIVTHLPAFYKTNLYNEIAQRLNIFVIFVADQSKQRTADFINLKCKFEYVILNVGNFEERSICKSLFKLKSAIKQLSYKKLLVSGWDLPEFWWLVFASPKEKNALALESTILESKASGLKGAIKRFFLTRISTVFTSGKLHADLLKKLNFNGCIKITKGVGIINKTNVNKQLVNKIYRREFLYLGRLSPEKNLHLLIRVFNHLPSHKLSIVGSGPLKSELTGLAKENISFFDHVDNRKLSEVFSRHDVMILPSLSETWGLVVEEALHFGLPVMVSKNCGVSELIQNGVNGFVFDPVFEELSRAITTIETKNFERIVEGVRKFSIEAKNELQVNAYREN